MAEAVLRGPITPNSQLEQFRMLGQDSLLELEHQLWIHHWRGLRAASIDILLGVLHLIGFPKRSHLVNTMSLPEHVL